MAHVFNFPPLKRLAHVVVPQLAPYFAAATRAGLSLVWTIVLVVELMGRPNGVGFEINTAFQLFDVPLLLAYALPFTAIMLVSIETFAMQPFERHVSRWRPARGWKRASRASPFGPRLDKAFPSSPIFRSRLKRARPAR